MKYCMYILINSSIYLFWLGRTIEQLELTTDTIYEVPTEGVITSKIVGTNDGRIFLASEDGNLFEIDYWVTIIWNNFFFINLFFVIPG